ncbi:MFS transporter [Bacillus sp. DTU_2020_1000418_1_SI_GHA_SEK_038]|uniref:MDR family MFS transporter n=1 Tax=Bacillus sp. DTU_2020_1000418_1_SI_GHA_SEK_038 TaxID=3077585 RepID=UPI0028E73D17|nr:MFS transporter [Bacillus sp. DTU_2020_1000418_1_SI_GHA_SEK_038]WNS76555.1 MFS transporter [Bacillus sp. DTU_2020_1000418_1_SI_GHA_SEK_038]
MSALNNLHPLVWNIVIGTVFGRMATSMSIPFLAIYLTNVKGVSPTQTGLIIAVSSLVGIATSFFGGYFSDRFGRKRVLLISIFLWAFVFIGFGIVEAVWGFFFMNALNGFCRSTFEPASRALLADLTEPKNRLIIFNLRYTAINVGVIFGPILGFYLGSSKSTFAFFIAAGVYALYGLSLLITYQRTSIQTGSKENEGPGNRVKMIEAFRITKSDSILLWSLIGFILAITGYSQLSSTLPQYLSNTSLIENGAKTFSFLLAFNALTVISIQYPLLKIGKKYSPLTSIMLGSIMVSLGLIGFGLARGMLVWIIVMMVFTAGEVLMFSMTDLFMDNIAKPNLRGTYFGAMGFTQIGNVIGPALGGFLLDTHGYDKPILVFGLLCFSSLLAIPILLGVMAKMKNQSLREAQT